MKVVNLTVGSNLYTSNVYLVTGSWNALPDVNTLIDVGRDPSIIPFINNFNTGFGKKKVEQVILTHSHYDHSGLLMNIRKEFNPRVYGASEFQQGIDVVLLGGERIQVGDHCCEIIATPCHSSDSLCIFDPEDSILFSGDTQLVIQSSEGEYEPGFIRILEKLATLPIRVIYPGHGKPIIGDCAKMIEHSILRIRDEHPTPSGE